MKYTTRKKAVLLLADGTIFYGKAIGKEGTALEKFALIQA